ncbi:alpha/beta fold hydrolase [Endozoicomonadaceae bacterium StTr2]
MKLYGKVQGTGQPLVMLHGLFGTHENLGGLSRQLAENYQVHALDLRNHGRSPHVEEMNYPAMAADVREYIEEHQLGSVVVVGHSMGGKVAMQLTLESPELVSSLVVLDIAPAAYGDRHKEIFKGLYSLDLEELSSRAAADQPLAEYVTELPVRQFLLKNLVRGENGFKWRMNLFAIYQGYQNIVSAVSEKCWDGKTLFIRGDQSDYITQQHRNDIVMRFPSAKVVTIEGTGHWLHAEKPAAVLKVINRFLAN